MSRCLEAHLFPPADLRAEIEALAPGFEPAWYTTLNADATKPAWFIAREGGRVVGFLTVFDPSGQAAEVSAWVEPSRRNQGHCQALLAEARRVWDQDGRRWLLVVDRSSAPGVAVARQWGTLSFTESTLGLSVAQRPEFSGLPDGLMLSEGEADDVHAAAEVFHQAHGEDGHLSFLQRILSDPDRRFFVLKEGDETVGVGCLHRDNGQTMVHGLVVHPERQGRGWGRALVTALLDLGARETQRFLIEVDSTNHRAERLYRSLGFQDLQVTDYYQL